MSQWRGALLLFAATLAVAAHATTYTCVGADGKTSFSDRPCPSSAAEAQRRDAGARGYLAARHGLTFGVQALDDGAVDARCDAAPAPTERPRDGACDAQRGDTACTRELPVLCFKPGKRRAPAPAVVDAGSGRISWPVAPGGPQLGASPALRGERLASQQSGTQACEQALGSGWRMASVADSAAWGPQALHHASLTPAAGRVWVATDDTSGNCWSAPPAPPPLPQVAADEKQVVTDLLKLRSSPEYARLPPKCKQSYDQLERALRQNPNGALLGEASFEPLLQWLQDCGAHAAPPR